LKRGVVFFILIFLVSGTRLFARGNVEESEIKTQNDEWILCVSDFDLSALPEEKKAIATVITRKVVERLSAINYRARVSEEFAFYEESAWNRSRSNAAKALAAKREERSLLIFRGEAQWRYRQNLARLDAEIEKLVLALQEADSNMPYINSEPLFSLTQANLDLSFPSAPKEGSEYRFCIDQKADGLLVGTVTEFYSRYIVSLKLYTIYTQSVVWEDSVIFSHENLEDALDEITRRLMITLSGNDPAVLTISAQPENALVLINRSFVSRGDAVSLEYPPGRVTVTASAPEHESVSFEADLFAGEQTLLSINLKPFNFVDVEIDGFPLSGSVYNGALYMGESPLTLRLPVNQLEYIELVTPDSQSGTSSEASRGTIVFRPIELQSNLTTGQWLGESSPLNFIGVSISINTVFPVEAGHVGKMRDLYYHAWGATWITGIAAWLTYHSYLSSNSAISYYNWQTGTYDPGFQRSNMNMYYASMGTAIAVGVVGVLGIIQMIRYIYAANKGSTPAVRTGR